MQFGGDQPMTAIVVLDVGKTVSKLSLWEPDGNLIKRETRPNAQICKAGRAVLDVEGIAAWLVATLKSFATVAKIGHIIPVAHGAGLALVQDGVLVEPPLDYEYQIPESVRQSYMRERDPFSVTGSPFLHNGLNAALQLYWRTKEADCVLDRMKIMPWAQYWAWFLSGVMRSEVSSLGCHTDLWSPLRNEFSPMTKRFGWDDMFPAMAFAGEAIGHLRPNLASDTGLSRDVQVHCGVHDSNAALVAAQAFPQMESGEATVLSTGTWFVAMRRPAMTCDTSSLSEKRDCLVNVDVHGLPIPSARFMGGREIELLSEPDTLRVDSVGEQAAFLQSVAEVIDAGCNLSPTSMPGNGPFPSGQGKWNAAALSREARAAAICLYAGMVANASLDLVGSCKAILIEGRFAKSDVFVRALASLRPDGDIYISDSQSDVSFGALRLINPLMKSAERLTRVRPLDQDLSAYATAWRENAEMVETRNA